MDPPDGPGDTSEDSEPGDLLGASVVEAMDAGDDDDEELVAGASTLRTVRPDRPGLDRPGLEVMEQGTAGAGYGTEGRDDVWKVSDPDSEEVRLDPLFRRLLFNEPPRAEGAIGESAATPDAALRLPEAAPGSHPAPGPSFERLRHGAVDSASNRPGARTDAPPSPRSRESVRPTSVRSNPVPDLSTLAPTALLRPGDDVGSPSPVSAAPQPQAAQERPRAEGRPESSGFPEPPPQGDTLRITVDMFGTPTAVVRDVEPTRPRSTGGTARPRSVPNGGDRAGRRGGAEVGDDTAKAGIMAIGGLGALSILAAVVLLSLAFAVFVYQEFVAHPGQPSSPTDTTAPVTGPAAGLAPAEAAPVDASGTEDEGSDAPPEGAETSAPPVAGEVASEPAPVRKPRPKAAPAPEPAPEPPAPVAPAPVVAPAPPPPAPVQPEEADPKGRKRKKK